MPCFKSIKEIWINKAGITWEAFSERLRVTDEVEILIELDQM